MRHLDPADRISLINEALTYLFEINDKPLQQMMGTDWVAQSTPTFNKTNKPTTPTIGAYDTSPEAKNVRRITTRAQADRQLATDISGVEPTGNAVFDFTNRLLNPMGRVQQTLGDIAAVRGAGAGRSPVVAKGSSPSKLTRTQPKAITAETRAATTGLGRSQSIGNKSTSTVSPDHGEISYKDKAIDWDELVRRVEAHASRNTGPEEKYEVISPITRLRRTLGISPEKAEELRRAQIDAFEKLDPEAQTSAMLLHGDPRKSSYWDREIRTATLNPSSPAGKGTHVGTRLTDPDTDELIYSLGMYYDSAEFGGDPTKTYSVIDNTAGRKEKFRATAHEEGHAQQNDTLSDTLRQELRVGDYEYMPGEVGARVRERILHGRNEKRYEGSDPTVPLRTDELDRIVPSSPWNRIGIGGSPYTSFDIMKRLKSLYYPHFHVKNDKKQPGMETTRMA